MLISSEDGPAWLTANFLKTRKENTTEDKDTVHAAKLPNSFYKIRVRPVTISGFSDPAVLHSQTFQELL